MNCTPGKWYVGEWDYAQATPPRRELNIQTDEILLAAVQCDFTGDNPYTVPKDQAFGNANMMAASKQMYEALKEIEEWIVNKDIPFMVTERIRLSLAQAEGRK